VRKRQKQRINIGKFGDISLAFIRERKNELKLKKWRICMKKIANLYENSDKFTKVTNEWLAKTRLKQRIVFWLKGGLKCYFCHVLAQKKSAKSRKRCRLRANETIKVGKLQTALKVLNSLFKFAILHEYTKHKFIAGIDKTTL
jgi:DNA integration/recombination/inversion protein